MDLGYLKTFRLPESPRHSENIMSPSGLHLFLAGSDCAADYDPARLSHEDCQRINRTPALAQRTDWQVSRFLKQQAAGLHGVSSLSHSHGTAIYMIASNPLSISVGIDIEIILKRDFQALSRFFCNKEEQAWLQARHFCSNDFYLLWTLKESLLKACNLSFPADMCHVGLHIAANGSFSVRTPNRQRWHAHCLQIGSHYSACYVHNHYTSLPVTWSAFGACQQQPIQTISII